jgi:hypothetical protein
MMSKHIIFTANTDCNLKGYGKGSSYACSPREDWHFRSKGKRAIGS